MEYYYLSRMTAETINASIINITLIMIIPSYDNKFVKSYEFNLILSTKYFF